MHLLKLNFICPTLGVHFSLPFLGFSLPYALAHIYRSGRRQAHKLRKFYYTKPCAIIASATFTKPAMFAPVHNRKSVKKKTAQSAFFRIFLNLMHSLLFIGAAAGRRTSFANFIILNLVLSLLQQLLQNLQY